MSKFENLGMAIVRSIFGQLFKRIFHLRRKGVSLFCLHFVRKRFGKHAKKIKSECMNTSIVKNIRQRKVIS